jgi:hypothetical protein
MRFAFVWLSCMTVFSVSRMVSATFIGLLYRVLFGVRERRVFYIKAPSSGRLKSGSL